MSDNKRHGVGDLVRIKRHVRSYWHHDKVSNGSDTQGIILKVHEEFKTWVASLHASLPYYEVLITWPGDVLTKESLLGFSLEELKVEQLEGEKEESSHEKV